jgi:hypothetical protein
MIKAAGKHSKNSPDALIIVGVITRETRRKQQKGKSCASYYELGGRARSRK